MHANPIQRIHRGTPCESMGSQRLQGQVVSQGQTDSAVVMLPCLPSPHGTGMHGPLAERAVSAALSLRQNKSSAFLAERIRTAQCALRIPDAMPIPVQGIETEGTPYPVARKPKPIQKITEARRERCQVGCKGGGGAARIIFQIRQISINLTECWAGALTGAIDTLDKSAVQGTPEALLAAGWSLRICFLVRQPTHYQYALCA